MFFGIKRAQKAETLLRELSIDVIEVFGNF